MNTPAQYVSKLRKQNEDLQPPSMLLSDESDPEALYDLSDGQVLMVQKDGEERTWHVRTDGTVVTIKAKTHRHSAESVRMFMSMLCFASALPIAFFGMAVPEPVKPVMGALLLLLFFGHIPILKMLPDRMLRIGEGPQDVRVVDSTPVELYKKQLRTYLNELSIAAGNRGLTVRDDKIQHVEPRRYEFEHNGSTCVATPAYVELVNESLQDDQSLVDRFANAAKTFIKDLADSGSFSALVTNE